MRKLFFAGALLGSLSLSAQVFSVTETERLKKAANTLMLPSGSNFIQVVPEYNKTVLPYGLGLRSVRVGFTVRKLNSNYDEIQAREVSKGEKKYAPSLYQVYQINGGIYLLFQEVSAANVLGSIKMSRIDTATLAFSEERELIKLDDKKYRETFYSFFQSDDTEVNFQLSKSPSGNYNMLFCDIVSGKKELQQRKKIMAAVFDRNMQLIFEKEHVFEITNKEFKLHEYRVDETGKVIVAYSAVTETPGVKKKDKIKTSTPHILHLSPAPGAVTDQVLTMNDWVASEIAVLILPVSGDVVIAGTYAGEYGGPKVGVFRTTFSKGSQTPAPVNFFALPVHIIGQFETEKMIVEGTKAKGLTHEFNTRLSPRDGDNYDVILEYNTSDTKDLPSRTLTTYHSGSILNIYFRDGKPVFTRIPKYAKLDYTNFPLSSNYVVYKENRVFFYIDDKDNLEKGIVDKPATLKNITHGVLVAAIVKPDGTVSRQIIAEPGDNYVPSVLGLDRIEPLKVSIPIDKYSTMSFSGKRKFLIITLK